MKQSFYRKEHKNNLNMIIPISIAIILILIPNSYAAANFAVTAFSCSPDEVAISEQFSCTTTVQNSGDATGSLTTATLFPDATSWLESSSYPNTVNTNVDSGASTSVVFTGLKGKKSGVNGFARIMLDDVTDTYVADNTVTVNVVDVLTTESSAASSAAASASVDVTGQATVGGNVNTELKFTVTSGGCTIGSQQVAATTNGMTDGQTTSHTWTVTLGTTDCVYSVAGKVTSTPDGTGTKTDTDTGTITCSSGCSSGSSSSSSGGGGGGGGAAAVIVADTSQKNIASFKTHTFAKIEQGATPIASIDKPEIAISEIKFEAAKSLANVEIKVSSLKDKPTVMPAAEKVYQYLEIAPKNLKSTDMNKATITFKVTRYWLNANGFKESDVALSRYASDAWTQLPTKVASSDVDAVTYSAETPGFSYFAIVSNAVKAEKAVEKPKEPEVKQQDDKQKQAADDQKKSAESVSSDKLSVTKKGSLFSRLFEGNNLIWTTVAIGMLFLLALYYYPHEKIKENLNKKYHKHLHNRLIAHKHPGSHDIHHRHTEYDMEDEHEIERG